MEIRMFWVETQLELTSSACICSLVFSLVSRITFSSSPCRSSMACCWRKQKMSEPARPAAGHIGPWKVRRRLIAKKMSKVFSTLIWGIKVCLSALSVNPERNPGIKLCPLNPLQQPWRCRLPSLSSRTGRPLCSGLNPRTDARYTNTRG